MTKEMRKINDNEYEIETSDNGVLHFVIGCYISANTRIEHSTLNQTVKGKFNVSPIFGAVIDDGERRYPIDEKTISCL